MSASRFNGALGPSGSILLTPGQGVRGAYTALGYKAATIERRSAGRHATSGSGDTHLRHDRLLLGDIANRFMRDNGIYRGIVNRFVDAVYGGTGFILDIQTGNKSLNKRVADRWKRFGDDPEVRGLFQWTDVERMALMSICNHGDVGAIHTTRRKFQMKESEEIGGRRQLSSTSTRNGERWESGVLLDKLGRPLAYRVHGRSQSGHVKSGKGTRIAAKNMTFSANRDRFSQTRGVPILVSTFAMIHRISDVIDSEAVSWQNLAKFALTVTRENSAEQAYNESRPDTDGETQGPNGDGDIANRVMELEEAIMFFANKGETIKGIERNLPGKDFPESVRMFLRLIGMPLGIPLEVILLDYHETNYTAARASLEQAYRMFQVWQSFLKRTFHTPLYRRWLQWELDAGTLPKHPKLVADAAGLGLFHTWGAPEFPWIDHLKEAEAWGLRMDRGLATQTMALSSINMEHDSWLATRKAEVTAAIECAKTINDANPEANVDWRMFAAVPVSKTQGMLETQNSQQPPQNAPVADSRANDPDASEQSRGHLIAERFAEDVPEIVPTPVVDDPMNPRIIVPPVEITLNPTFNLDIERVEAGEVTAGDVQAGAVTAGDVEAGAVTAGDVQAGEVKAGDVQAGDVAAGSVTAGDVAAGEVKAGAVNIEEVKVDAPVTVNLPKRSRSMRVEREGGKFGPVQRIVEE